MRFRKLRIAWSVMCAIACVLLIVMWVRSYSHRDTFEKIDALGITVCSIQRGTLMFARMLGNVAFDEIGHWNWTVDYEAIQSNFTAATYADEWIFIPLWFPVLLLAV